MIAGGGHIFKVGVCACASLSKKEEKIRVGFLLGWMTAAQL